MVDPDQADISGALQGDEEAAEAAHTELAELSTDWSQSAWDELDWSRVKDMNVRDVLDKRRAAAEVAQSCECLQCPKFVTHVRRSEVLAPRPLLS